MVLERFCEDGMPPSEIDALLGLPKGRARDVIVAWWHEDKVAARRKG